MKRILFLLSAFVVFNVGFGQNLTPSDADSKVAFVIKNVGIGVDGTLKGLKGNIKFDPKNLSASSFDVTVDVATINTDNTKRDNHLRNDDFFDAPKYPTIRIRTTKISSSGGNNHAASATLTIKNKSKNISLPFTAKPTSNGYTFTGSFTINRLDFGVGGSSLTMSDDVKVNLTVVAKK